MNDTELKTIWTFRNDQCPTSIMLPLNAGRQLFVGRQDGGNAIYDLSLGNFISLSQFEVSTTHATYRQFNNLLSYSSYNGELWIAKDEGNGDWKSLSVAPRTQQFTVAIGFVEDLDLLYQANLNESLSAWLITEDRLTPSHLLEPLPGLEIRLCEAISFAKGGLLILDSGNNAFLTFPRRKSPWKSTRIEHGIEGDIHLIRANANLTALASGTCGTVCVRSNRDAFSPSKLLTTQDAGLLNIALAPSGVRVIGADLEDHLYLWDLSYGSMPLAIAEFTGLTKVAVSSSGRFVVAGSSTEGMQVWDSAKRELVCVAVPGLVRDGVSFLVSDEEDRFIVGHVSGEATLIDLVAQNSSSLTPITGNITDARFVGLSRIALSNSDGEVHVIQIVR